MDIRQLESFVEVAKQKSFSKAAKNLFVSQPTITNHIQNLEKEFGFLLINRFGRQIELTDEGKILFKHAINILNTCETVKFDLAAYQGKIHGHLDIFSSSVPRKYLLPKVLTAFTKSYPDVTFSLREQDSSMVVQSIAEGRTDFGILGSTYNTPSIGYVELMKDKLVLITPPSKEFRLERRPKIDASVLFQHPFIWREEGSGTRSLTESVLRKNGMDIAKLRIVAEVEDTETIKLLVAEGCGISIISETAIQKELKENSLLAFQVERCDFSRSFYFAYHRQRQLSPLNEAFKTFLCNFKSDPQS